MRVRGCASSTRFARTVFALAVAVLTIASPATPQPAGSDANLAAEFSSSLADALPRTAPVQLRFAKGDARMQAELTRLLASRGVRVVESGDATVVTIACDANLRERVCAAEIGHGESRRVVFATRQLDPAVGRTHDPIVAIDIRPIYTQRGVMLDVADAGAHLLVLTPDAVLLAPSESSGAGATGGATPSQPIRTSRIWPRDLRGMLRVTGTAFQAFLPGLTCRGAISPFTVTCADEIEPWPIGVDNGGLTASRNTFATPEGLGFYEAASVGRHWLLVGEHAALTWIDGARSVVARGDAADHVAGFAGACGDDGPYVVTSARGADADSENLRLWRVSATELTAMPSTVGLPGILTSLWSASDGHTATAVVHDVKAGRYEAFHISLSCAR